MAAETTHDLLQGIRRWVEIESQTADAVGVNTVMALCASEYEAFGAHVTRIPGRNGLGDHLDIRSPWGGDGPYILVLSHLDTVHPRGTLTGPLPYRVDGDRAYGPGIYDMKGGAYIALAAMREMAAKGIPNSLPIRCLIVSDEEIGSPTSRALIEAAGAGAKYVLVTEPARDGGKIVTARKGVGRYDMRAVGRPAHSGSRHADGRSAIREICRQVLAIEAKTDYARGITFNIGQIAGGTADNVVPAECHATIDMRVLSVADAREMEAFLFSLKPHDPDVKLAVTGGLNRPPFEKNAGVAMLLAKARAIAAELDLELVDCATGGGSDGNFVADRVPTLDGLGVDGDGAHTLHEHLYISSLEPRMRLLQRLFEQLD
jgi:glutamate carboxypeptidase